MYTGDNYLPLPQGKLVWLVDLSRPTGPPARYVVDATEPFLLDVIERSALSSLITGVVSASPEITAETAPLAAKSAAFPNLVPAQNAPLIETYDSQGTKVLPRTPARVGDNPPVGRSEVDNAHNFTRETFDYFLNVHGRNSFDNQGTVMRSTVNYGRNYVNAFWEGLNLYTAYGTGLAVKDVVAHEWAHAVTQHTANLEYRWQSGALNESFSDIFAAMVDRDDWLLGEDIPSRLLGGADAIRSMSNPEAYGQPAHTDDWKRTCSNNQGVHTNSGITNHAYYLIATNIGKDKAEQIFYRALTVYLQPRSSLRDARAAALSAAADLYERDDVEYVAVDQGFRYVGITSNWNPPTNNCSCAATQVLAERSLFANAVQALDIAITLYQVRDQVMDGEALGQRYRALYEEQSDRIGELILSDTALSAQAAHLLQSTQPGMQSLADANAAAEIVTAQDVQDLTTFLQDLARHDREQDGGVLAQTIDQELQRTNLQKLVGMTYTEAWDFLNNTAHTVYMPMIAR
ncbi:MAG: M4 family peptidase [Candidatus Viridilinea halotolerans]|uniref:Neutral metalloproteinase n=1 Tax=Candidatus Viridilinea halotolerans TaxID=2491704 RepID=A0A426UCI4_9CHLR|nr:MAG: M4 family peptidase [Candidatus Viridilinea halotolerans]